MQFIDLATNNPAAASAVPLSIPQAVMDKATRNFSDNAISEIERLLKEIRGKIEEARQNWRLENVLDKLKASESTLSVLEGQIALMSSPQQIRVALAQAEQNFSSASAAFNSAKVSALEMDQAQSENDKTLKGLDPFDLHSNKASWDLAAMRTFQTMHTSHQREVDEMMKTADDGKAKESVFEQNAVYWSLANAQETTLTEVRIASGVDPTAGGSAIQDKLDKLTKKLDKLAYDQDDIAKAKRYGIDATENLRHGIEPKDEDFKDMNFESAVELAGKYNSINDVPESEKGKYAAALVYMEMTEYASVYSKHAVMKTSEIQNRIVQAVKNARDKGEDIGAAIDKMIDTLEQNGDFEKPEVNLSTDSKQRRIEPAKIEYIAKQDANEKLDEEIGGACKANDFKDFMNDVSVYHSSAITAITEHDGLSFDACNIPKSPRMKQKDRVH